MVSISKEQHLDMFLKMQQIRDVDMKLNKLVRRGFVQGMTHFSVGEEAAAVGPIAGLTDQDIIFSHHRGHGHVIAKGIDINGMMAELAGKATGTSKGRGGSMHLANIEKGNFGKASMPSFWSAMANRAWNRRRSNITPSDRPLSKARLTASLAAMAAMSE